MDLRVLDDVLTLSGLTKEQKVAVLDLMILAAKEAADGVINEQVVPLKNLLREWMGFVESANPMLCRSQELLGKFDEVQG